MATALIQGLISTQTARREQLLVSDIRSEGLVHLRDKFGVRTTLDNRAACQSEIVILSVKPQNFSGLLPTLAPHLAPSTLVISIAAGVPLQAIEAALPHSRVVRAMPNTPALVSAGATAIAGGGKATAEDLALATKIFASVPIAVFDRGDIALRALAGRAAARYRRARVTDPRRLAGARPPAWCFLFTNVHPASSTEIRRKRRR